MRQQVNLYQSNFRAARKPASAAVVAASLGVVLLGLLLVWTYAQRQVTRLERNVEILREQQQRQTEAMTVADAMHGARANPVLLQAQLKTLNKNLAVRQRALELLRSGAAGEPGGFSAELTALARRHTEGVWLDRMVFASGAGVVSLSGGALKADLVPRYLRGLAAEPALAGTHFDEFRIEDEKYSNAQQTDNSLPSKNKPLSIRFRASNTAADGSAKQESRS